MPKSEPRSHDSLIIHTTEKERHRDTKPALEPRSLALHTHDPQQEKQWHQGGKLTTLSWEQEEEERDQPGHSLPHQVPSGTYGLRRVFALPVRPQLPCSHP